ncbi:transcription antitermination factor NusB [Pelomicrobium sp.]|uniref:transcription antitermination factor NusB n=1 Tax=Pelomicrobium sp. TaxID=2815319 RepID=UPI002FDEB68D
MKTARRRAREFALQALYQWRLTGYDMDSIAPQVRAQKDFAHADGALFEALAHGVAREAQALEAILQPHLDRPASALSPVEHCILLIGAFELAHHPEIPYRVVINEAVELAKTFGGTEGHKYVNGVLDKLASRLRAVEVAAPRGSRS